jgi:hypothetical protein
MSAFIRAFQASPGVRFWTRVVVVAVIGYFATFFTTTAVDQFEPINLLWGLGGATFSGLAYALLGGTTPIEPFVGTNKVDVQVPSPPATTVRREAIS